MSLEGGLSRRQCLGGAVTAGALTVLSLPRAAMAGAQIEEPLRRRRELLPLKLYFVEIAKRDGIDPLEVARVHFALGERLGLSMLVARILALPRDDRWQTMARAALRDDHRGHRPPLPRHVRVGVQALRGGAPRSRLVAARVAGRAAAGRRSRRLTS